MNDYHERSSFYSQIPRDRRHNRPHRDTRGSSRVGQEAEGREGKKWVEAFIGVSQERKVEAGLAGLRLAGLSSFMGCGGQRPSQVTWFLVVM